MLPSGTAPDAARDTLPDVDDFEGLTSTRLRIPIDDAADDAPVTDEPTTRTGLRAPRLSKPLPSRTTGPRLPAPVAPPRPSLVPTEDEPRTQLRQSVALPPPLAGCDAQERTVVLALPPVDPTPPPAVAIRTPFAMCAPTEERAIPTRDRDRDRDRAPALEAEVLGQRLPLSRVAAIVGATLLVAAIVVAVGLRADPAAAMTAAPTEPVTVLPAPVSPVPPVASSPAAPPPPPVVAAEPASAATGAPPVPTPTKHPPHRARRIPFRQGK